ncbi:MAG: hypothetical protein Q8P41_02805 [Pseudomonadota bacterium]|nr:hypothetical protein [Pseudomonadota bacterium]
MADPRGKTPGPSRFGEQLYQSWEKAMGAWWDQVLQSPAFLGAMSENLSARTQARATYERTMEGAMDRMHLPTRKDIVRVARVATLLEERLLAQEDLLLSLKDQLAAAQRESVQARIESMQARIELQDELRALRAELSAAPAVLAVSPPGAPRVAASPPGAPVVAVAPADAAAPAVVVAASVAAAPAEPAPARKPRARKATP